MIVMEGKRKGGRRQDVLCDFAMARHSDHAEREEFEAFVWAFYQFVGEVVCGQREEKERMNAKHDSGSPCAGDGSQGALCDRRVLSMRDTTWEGDCG